MVGEVFMTIFFFATVFGIFYLFVTSRHKERMAMIERGLTRLPQPAAPRNYSLLVILLLNLAVLSASIGASIFIGAILEHHLKVDSGIAYPGSIFLMAGLGLFLGHRFTVGIIERARKNAPVDADQQS
ncbi:MAG: DUF6249 domain-containing protein [bacterium]|jgi:hypothetical protein|nr:hypothetical protein [Chitinophagaceae bacterium]